MVDSRVLIKMMSFPVQKRDKFDGHSRFIRGLRGLRGLRDLRGHDNRLLQGGAVQNALDRSHGSHYSPLTSFPLGGPVFLSAQDYI